MNMKSYMLDKVIGWIIGGDIFMDIKNIVMGLLEEDIPGNEKRAKAIRQAKALGTTLATFLLNLAIEAAVMLAKEQQLKARG